MRITGTGKVKAPVATERRKQSGPPQETANGGQSRALVRTAPEPEDRHRMSASGGHAAGFLAQLALQYDTIAERRLARRARFVAREEAYAQAYRIAARVPCPGALRDLRS